MVSKMLELTELKAGMHIEVRDRMSGSVMFHGIVKEIVDDYDPIIYLVEVGGVHGREVFRFAADIGLVAYHSGKWNDEHRTYMFGDNRPHQGALW